MEYAGVPLKKDLVNWLNQIVVTFNEAQFQGNRVSESGEFSTAPLTLRYSERKILDGEEEEVQFLFYAALSGTTEGVDDEDEAILRIWTFSNKERALLHHNLSERWALGAPCAIVEAARPLFEDKMVEAPYIDLDPATGSMFSMPDAGSLIPLEHRNVRSLKNMIVYALLQGLQGEGLVACNEEQRKYVDMEGDDILLEMDERLNQGLPE